MTQMSASRTSRIWLAVRRMMPAKMDTCWDMSRVAKPTPKISPRYLLRSPVSMRSATQFIAAPPRPDLSLGPARCYNVSESSRSLKIIRAIAHIVKGWLPMANRTKLRRAPKQERGQRRIGRILQAAAEEFARVGFDAATTNSIARRARTSVGSLYQFFPNKEAILAALTEHYLREIWAVHAVVLSAEAARLPLPVFFDQLVDRLADFH